MIERTISHSARRIRFETPIQDLSKCNIFHPTKDVKKDFCPEKKFVTFCVMYWRKPLYSKVMAFFLVQASCFRTTFLMEREEMGMEGGKRSQRQQLWQSQGKTLTATQVRAWRESTPEEDVVLVIFKLLVSNQRDKKVCWAVLSCNQIKKGSFDVLTKSWNAKLERRKVATSCW